MMSFISFLTISSISISCWESFKRLSCSSFKYLSMYIWTPFKYLSKPVISKVPKLNDWDRASIKRPGLLTSAVIDSCPCNQCDERCLEGWMRLLTALCPIACRVLVNFNGEKCFVSLCALEVSKKKNDRFRQAAIGGLGEGMNFPQWKATSAVTQLFHHNETICIMFINVRSP